MLKLQGQALIATHQMDEDDEDWKSVWAVLDHTSDATTLLCLNRSIEAEIEMDIRHRIPGIPETMRILRGGSMEGFEKHMVFLHQDPVKLSPSVEIGGKFRISMKHENVHEVADAHAPHCRIALGFETWSPQDLEDEIREGLWALRDISYIGSTFFKVSPEELWSRLQAH